MSVTKPNSGQTTTPLSVTSMYDSVKDIVNATGTGEIGDSAFGPQVLPSCMPNLIGSSTAGTDNAAITADVTISSTGGSASVMNLEAEADVVTSTAWAEIVKLDDGYLLPPCKVLVMFDATVKAISKHASDDAGEGQAWFSVYHTANYGGSDVVEWDLTNMGMLFAYKDGSTTTGGVTTTINEPTVHESISIWYIIDKTALTDNWTLKSIKAVGALGTGEQPHARRPPTMVISHANLSFASFYKDS